MTAIRQLTRHAGNVAALSAVLTVEEAGLAFAAGSGASAAFQPIQSMATEVQQFMLGGFATSIFVIGLVALGISCLRSMVPWGWLVAYIIGASLAFGAPQIVGTLQSALGT